MLREEVRGRYSMATMRFEKRFLTYRCVELALLSAFDPTH